MLGFNRRFDPDNAALCRAVREGEIGRVTMLMSWSREPAPPPIEYVRSSGGYFVDATIHDIDLLCWIAGERPVEVQASGSCMFDPAIGEEGDFDLTMTTLKMPSRRVSFGRHRRPATLGECRGRPRSAGDRNRLCAVRARGPGGRARLRLIAPSGP